jgi:uncharacterized protein with HEPN domain
LQRSSRLYIEDILKAIDNLVNYTKGYSKEKLENDQRTLDACLRNLQVIREAITQLPQEVKDKRPEIPWREIQQFRINVVHHYWKIDLDILWDVIATKLKPLQKRLKKLLETLQ